MSSSKNTYWLFTTEFPPYYGGGISTYCTHTVATLKDSFDLTVFVPDLNTSDYIIKQTGDYRVIAFHPTFGTAEEMGYTARLSRRFYDISSQISEIDTVPPNVIETQDYNGIGYFTIHKKRELAPHLQNTHIILTAHSPSFLCMQFEEVPMYTFPEYWIHYMEKYCYLNADAVIYPSKFIQTEVHKLLSPNQNESVIPHPFQPTTSDLSEINFDSLTEIAYVGAINKLKGVDNLCAWIKNNFWDKGNELTLRLIGRDGYAAAKNLPYSKLLAQKYSSQITSNTLIYEGLVAPELISQKTTNSKIFIIPSLFESFSYAACEQLALGKIVIASTTGGQSELIQNDETGFVYTSEFEFTKALQKSLALSKEEYQNITTAAQKFLIKHCSYKNVLRQKQSFINSLSAPSSSNIYNFVFDNRRDIDPPKPLAKTPSTKKLQKSLLSVIVPFYNMEEYVDETIDSLLNSTYTNLEILVVNDGSTSPNSPTKLQELKTKSDKIKILEKPNGGLASARNFGFEHASGEFACIIDSDDYISPDYLEHAVKILSHYENIHFVSCYSQSFGANTEQWCTWDAELPYFLYHNSFVTSCLVYKTSAALTAATNDPAMTYGMEDYESAVNMLNHGFRAIVITEPYFQYRVRPDSMFRQFNFNSIAFLTAKIANKHANLFSPYATELACLYNQSGSSFLMHNPTFETQSTAKMRAVLTNTPPTLRSELKNIVVKILIKFHLLPLAKLFKHSFAKLFNR
ncbi:glycosyltransferase [Candidatus Saccharibacteria bacterium]|nr:glycosyltransferase [Candidatus Saccharibacteria bacterium]